MTHLRGSAPCRRGNESAGSARGSPHADDGGFPLGFAPTSGTPLQCGTTPHDAKRPPLSAAPTPSQPWGGKPPPHAAVPDPTKSYAHAAEWPEERVAAIQVVKNSSRLFCVGLKITAAVMTTPRKLRSKQACPLHVYFGCQAVSFSSPTFGSI
jgi:hypothetical protein